MHKIQKLFIAASIIFIVGSVHSLAQLDGAVLREGHVQKEHDPDVLFFLDGFFSQEKRWIVSRQFRAF